MYNKITEVKNLIKKENPHILGISEAELRKSCHDLNSLSIPGYDLILPLSWEIEGQARVVIFIKRSLSYEQVNKLEDPSIQSIWLRAGFKNMRRIYFCHQYREHTNSLGNSMACQREALQKMLDQWEMAAVHESDEAQNELHIMGDFNLDCYNGKWLHPKYSLRSLAKMVIERCNVMNMSQLVDKITRIQYNSISRELSSSCLDHVYSNAVFRC